MAVYANVTGVDQLLLGFIPEQRLHRGPVEFFIFAQHQPKKTSLVGASRHAPGA
jgi:hypothetical protein